MPFFDGATPTYNQRESHVPTKTNVTKDLDFVPIFKM